MRKFILFILVLSTLAFCGCKTNNNIKLIDNISSTLKTVKEVISNVELISSEFLVEQTNLNKDNNFEEGTGYNGATFTNAQNFNNKQISNIIQKTSSINNNTIYLINRVNSKSSNLLAICCLFENSSNKINENHSNAINNLCDSISFNSNYIKNNKTNYNKTNFYNVMSSYRYAEIINNIETLNSCLSSICFGIDNIYDILDNYNYLTEVQSDKNSTVGSWSNIDTYRNSKKQARQTTNTTPQLQYGRGGTNPYYNYGYGNRFAYGGYGGINGFGRYPYSPYSNYNPYMPNIDTFGTYTNVDTYQNCIDNNDLYYWDNNARSEEENTSSDDLSEFKSKPYLPKCKCDKNNTNKEYYSY